MRDLMEYAQRKLEEAEKNDSGHDMRYWSNYLDGVKASYAIIENQQTHITALMHQLDMARGERDAVTKRMIKLEQEIRRVKGEPGV